MEQHAASGELEAAVRQYLDCRQALARRLDLSPSAETEALLARTRSGALRKGDARRDGPPPAGSIVVAPWRFRAIISLEQQKPTTEDGAISALPHGPREALLRKTWLAVVDGIPDGAPAARMQPLEAAMYQILLHRSTLPDRRSSAMDSCNAHVRPSLRFAEGDSIRPAKFW